MRLLLSISSLFVLLAAQPSVADDDPLFDVYTVTAEASSNVDNDRAMATLIVFAEGKNPATLGDDVNRRMRSALDTVAEYPTVSSETRGYRTEPRYDASTTGGRRVSSWRVVQTLALSTTDIAALTEVLSQLQEDLQLQGLQFDVAPITRRVAIDGLIVEALEAFRARANIVASSMARTDYRVLDVEILSDTPGGSFARGGIAMMEARGSVAAPAVQGGDSVISVRVRARIQLTDGENP